MAPTTSTAWRLAAEESGHAHKSFKSWHKVGFNNDDGDLGLVEFEQEQVKKENRDQIQAIRKVLRSEIPEALQGLAAQS